MQDNSALPVTTHHIGDLVGDLMQGIGTVLTPPGQQIDMISISCESRRLADHRKLLKCEMSGLCSRRRSVKRKVLSN